MVIEMAERFGHETDIPLLQKRLAERKHMMTVAYFDINRTHGRGSNYCGNVQGANAFALDIGLGNQWTKDNFIAHYEKAPYYDTGIFGTDIVTRLLFEYGRGDLAYKLLTAKEPHGFGKWRADGATTFWEYWGKSRSHSHPMFGAVTAYLFEYILGVRQEKSDRGMTVLTVAPVDIPDLQWAKGHITTPSGEVHVEWKRQEDGTIDLWVKAPKGVRLTCNVTGEICID
jgi:alpha-L-rhamnosidase